MVTKRWWVVGLLLGVCCGVAQADRAKAKKLTDAAVKQFYKQGEWRKALEAYARAVAADPAYARVHYYMASAASLSGDAKLAAKELALVAAAAATDKEAAKLMKTALKDPDLDRATGNAEVRKLLGLPVLATLSAEQRLLERKGIWSGELTGGPSCGQWIQITFKPKGKLKFNASGACFPDSEADPVEGGSGTYKVGANGSLELHFKPEIFISVVPMDGEEPLLPCPGDEACFGQAGSANLHRGVPDLEYANQNDIQ